MAFGNVNASSALRAFTDAARAIKANVATVVREQQKGMQNPRIVIDAVASAKRALAAVEAASQMMRASGAWHRDYRNVLIEAQSAVASIDAAAEEAADEAARQSDAVMPERDFTFDVTLPQRQSDPTSSEWVSPIERAMRAKYPGVSGLRSRRRKKHRR